MKALFLILLLILCASVTFYAMFAGLPLFFFIGMLSFAGILLVILYSPDFK